MYRCVVRTLADMASQGELYGITSLTPNDKETIHFTVYSIIDRVWYTCFSTGVLGEEDRVEYARFLLCFWKFACKTVSQKLYKFCRKKRVLAILLRVWSRVHIRVASQFEDLPQWKAYGLSTFITCGLMLKALAGSDAEEIATFIAKRAKAEWRWKIVWLMWLCAELV